MNEFQRSERRDGVPGVSGVQRGRSNKRGSNGSRSELLECGETEMTEGRRTEGLGFNLCVAPSPRTESYFGGMKTTEDGDRAEFGIESRRRLIRL